MKNCKVCNQPIPEGRLKALPETVVCTEHSNAAAYRGNIVNVGKNEDDSYQEIDIIRDQSTYEKLEHYRSQQGQFKS
jgi:Prokaryotic dksA/traR C4-type zinc finger